MGGGVKIIPKEICIGVDGVDALRTGSHVCQRVPGGRGDDLIEESKDVKSDQVEVPATIEVVHDIKADGQDLVKKDAFLCRGNRGRGRTVEPGNQSKRREVGDDELRGSRIDEALDVDSLIEGRLDDIVR